MSITLVTRNAICDELRERGTDWSGRFSGTEFLRRLYPLDKLPSTDPRYPSADGDVECHAVRWRGDWPTMWVFDDPRFELASNDERLLAFLAEMLHPIVRPDTAEVVKLAAVLNQHLAKDGWELAEVDRISDRPVFAPRRLGHVAPIAPIVNVLDSAYVQRQISRMRDSIEKDPELAIGSAKDLLETICKTMLAKLGEQVDPADELPALIRRTLDALGVDVAGAQDPARAARAVQRLLGGLSGIGAAVGEVRNAVGTGHGRDAAVGDLQAMYARLAVNATATLATYLMDRYRAVKGT